MNKILFLILLTFIFSPLKLLAAELVVNNQETFEINSHAVRNGITISALGGDVKVGLQSGLVTKPGNIKISEIDIVKNDILQIPHGYLPISKVFSYEIDSDLAKKKDVWLSVKYNSDFKFRKFIFYWSYKKSAWIEMDSTTDLENNIVKSTFPNKKGMFVVVDTVTMTHGQASWYKYKGCMCAASPDYPKGSKLLVTNLNKNNESIVVTVNDWGPERDIFPDRVIDLDLVAFTKLGSKGTGIFKNIQVQPYFESDFTAEEVALLNKGGVIKIPEGSKLMIAKNIVPTNISNPVITPIPTPATVTVANPFTDAPVVLTGNYYFKK